MVAHELQNTCVFCKKTKDKVKKLFLVRMQTFVMNALR